MISGYQTHPIETYCELSGFVVWVDGTFTHGHGTKKQCSYDIINMQVRVWINSIEHVITESIDEKTLQEYKKEFLASIYKKDEMRAG